MSDEGDRLTYMKQVLREISRLNGSLEQEIYMKQLAGEFSISLDSLKEQLELLKSSSDKRPRARKKKMDLKSGVHICQHR